MTKIIFSITTRKITLAEIIDCLDRVDFDVSVCIACQKNNGILEEFSNLKKTKIPIELNIFSVGTCEDAMIDYSIKNSPASDIVLVRNDCQNLTPLSLEKLIQEGQNGCDIAMFKSSKPQSKFRSWLKNLGNKFCKSLLGFQHYDGDIGMQFFSRQAHVLLKNTNTTLLSKLNRWIALKISYVQHDIKPTKFPKDNFKKPLAQTLVYVALFALTLSLAFVFGDQISWGFLTILAFALAFVIELAMAFFHGLEIFHIQKVGLLNIKPTDAIDARFKD